MKINLCKLGFKQFKSLNPIHYLREWTACPLSQIMDWVSAFILYVIRVVFATVALGMGVDIKDIRSVAHITPPYTIQSYFQETGRAGRNGQPATAILYFNNRDIEKRTNQE